MKKILTFLTLVSSFIFANNIDKFSQDELFLLGKQAYKNGQYNEAIKL